MSRLSFFRKPLSESVLITVALLLGAGIVYASFPTLAVLSGISGLGFRLPHDSTYYSVTGNNSGTANSQNDTRIIKNAGAGDLFAPSRTSTEWNDFLNNAPGISVNSPSQYGCTNSNAINYNPSATIDDGSCSNNGCYSMHINEFTLAYYGGAALTACQSGASSPDGSTDVTQNCNGATICNNDIAGWRSKIGTCDGYATGNYVGVITSVGNASVCGSPGSHSYSWQTQTTPPWNTCSLSCGGGTQTRNVWCQRDDGLVVGDSYCNGGKPASSQSCNTQACGNHSCFDVSANFWEYTSDGYSQAQQNCSYNSSQTSSVSGATLVCDLSGNNCTHNGYSSGTYSGFANDYSSGSCQDSPSQQKGLAQDAGVSDLNSFFGRITGVGSRYSCP